MKKNLSIVSIVALLALLTLACNFPFGSVGIKSPIAEKGSGNVITSEPAISEFRSIRLAGAGELRLIQGSEYRLTIEAEDNILPQLTAEMSGSPLARTGAVQYSLSSTHKHLTGNLSCSEFPRNR